MTNEQVFLSSVFAHLFPISTVCYINKLMDFLLFSLSLLNLSTPKDTNFAFYEIHLELLQRAQALPNILSPQEPLHSLQLGNDVIDSRGKDNIVGDSATMYFQIDRSSFTDFGSSGFQFEEVKNKNDLPDLSGIMTERDATLSQHIETWLTPSVSLSNQELDQLPFADVPFYTFIGVDTINLYNNAAVAVGDFAAVGIVYSEISNNVPDLRRYAESVYILRKKPGVQSFMPSLSSLGNGYSFFNQRYTSDIGKLVEPQLHGDGFFAQSDENVLFGDFNTAAMYRLGTQPETYTLDKQLNFYGTFLNGEWAQFFDKDSVTVIGPATPIWVGQVSNDDVFGTVTKAKTDQVVSAHTELFFKEHGIAKQIVFDLKSHTIPYRFDSNGLRNVMGVSSPPLLSFTIPPSTYVPSHTKSIYIYTNVIEATHSTLPGLIFNPVESRPAPEPADPQPAPEPAPQPEPESANPQPAPEPAPQPATEPDKGKGKGKGKGLFKRRELVPLQHHTGNIQLESQIQERSEHHLRPKRLPKQERDRFLMDDKEESLGNKGDNGTPRLRHRISGSV